MKSSLANILACLRVNVPNTHQDAIWVLLGFKNTNLGWEESL